MKPLMTFTLVALLIFAFVSETSAQPWRYQKVYGEEYRQAVSQLNGAVNNVQIIQSSISSQRIQFNQGMTSPNARVRAQAKRVFLQYLSNLKTAYMRAGNACGRAIGAGDNYARALLGLNTTAGQGRGVVAEVRAFRSQHRSLRQTQSGIASEAQAARRR